jgi:hypothetical protein
LILEPASFSVDLTKSSRVISISQLSAKPLKSSRLARLDRAFRNPQRLSCLFNRPVEEEARNDNRPVLERQSFDSPQQLGIWQTVHVNRLVKQRIDEERAPT